MRVYTVSGVVIDCGMSVVIFILSSALAGRTADTASKVTASVSVSRPFMVGTPTDVGLSIAKDEEARRRVMPFANIARNAVL